MRAQLLQRRESRIAQTTAKQLCAAPHLSRDSSVATVLREAENEVGDDDDEDEDDNDDELNMVC